MPTIDLSGFRARADHARRWLLGYPDPNQPDGLDLPIREIAGPITYDGTKVRIWYRLYPTRWSFLTREEQQRALDPQMVAYAALAGRDLHRRRLPSEVPIAAWGARYAAAHPDIPDRSAFNAQLTRTMRWLHGNPRHRQVTYLGIELTDKQTIDRAFHAFRHRHTNRQQRAIAAALREIGEAAGVLGRPCTGAEVAMLVHRSVALGLPEPVNLQTGEAYQGPDLMEFTDGVTVHPNPGGRAVRIVGDRLRNGAPVERWVSVVSLGRGEELDIPGKHYPWIAYGDRLGFPIEWSEHVTVFTPVDARPEIEDKIKVIADQWSQYRKHPDIDVPPDVTLADAAAKAIRKELAEGNPVASCRARGHVQAVIIAPSEDECLDRVERFILHYRNIQTQYHRPAAQAGQVKAFIPGGAPVSESHQRRMRLGYWVSALPTVEAVLGDGEGMAIGHTDGTSKEPVFWNPHKAIIDGEMTGTLPIAGGLGSGKTTFAADVVHEGTIANQRWTIVDPSGPLGGMVGLDDYRGGRAYLLDLMHADPGAGSPFALIHEPRRDEFHTGDEKADDDAYHRACVDARAARKTLALDLLQWTLPVDIARQGAEKVLRSAIRETKGAPDASIADVVAALKTGNGQAVEIAEHLEELADHPAVRLFWSAGDPGASLADYRLLVITIAGFVMPDFRLDRREWSVDERLSMVATLIGAHVATKRIYDCPMEEPKGFMQDEAHILRQWSSGKALESRIDRDSRKWRVRALMCSHNASEFLADGRGNRVNEVVIGHTDDEDAQRDALRLLRVQTGRGYEATLGNLSPLDQNGNRPPWRRFAMRDAMGRVEVFKTDMRHKPHLLRAISPKDKRVALDRAAA